MATYYIDPSKSVNGDGSEESPFNTWASVSWSAGNSYLQKANTVAYEQITIGASGTSSSPIYIGKYGTGKNPIAGKTAQYGLYSNVKQHYRVEDFDFSGATDHGVYLRSTGGSNITNITFNRCNSYSNENNGFYLDSVVLNGTINFVTFSYCTAYNNLEHGWNTMGIVKYVFWLYCKAWNNGASVLGHGFSLHPFASTSVTSGWTATGVGTSYSRSLSASEDVQKLINRTTHVTYTKNSGATTGVAAGEWDQSGTTLYVNTGSNPNTNTTIAFKRAPHGPFFYFYCEAFKNRTDAGPGEGHGFAADDMSGPVLYLGCYSHENQGAGFQNQWSDNVTIRGCIAYKNKLSNFRTTGHTNTLLVYNNTSISSEQHGYFFDLPFSGTELKNNIAINNGITSSSYYGLIASTTGITAANNNTYNNGSTETNHTNNITNTNGVTDNPLLDSKYCPQNASVKNAGTYLDISDFYGKRFGATPNIGAVEDFVAKSVTNKTVTTRAVSSRTVKIRSGVTG